MTVRLAIFLFIFGLASAQAETRKALIVGNHIGLDPNENVLGFVKGQVQSSLFDVGGTFLEQPEIMLFLNEVKVDDDENLTLDLGSMLQLYEARTDALILVAGLFLGTDSGTDSRLVLGQTGGGFNVVVSRANLVKRQGHADERTYVNVLIAYALVREANARGGDPREVAIPIARSALEWANDLDETEFPDIVQVKSDLTAVLP